MQSLCLLCFTRRICLGIDCQASAAHPGWSNNSPANICTPHKHRLLQRLKRLELAFGQSVKYLRQPLKLCHETSCTPSRFLLQTLTSPGRRTGIVGIIGLEDQNAPLIICIVTHSLLSAASIGPFCGLYPN